MTRLPRAGDDDDDDGDDGRVAREERTITPRHNGPQAAVNYRVRSALVSAAFGESLVAARNFRCNKETHIWRFHYRAQLFQGRGALNKFIRHLTVIKDTRHAEARVIAIVLSPPLNGVHTRATDGSSS